MIKWSAQRRGTWWSIVSRNWRNSTARWRSGVTSDGGLVLVRELDERLGLSELVDCHLSDCHRGKNIQLPLGDRRSPHRAAARLLKASLLMSAHRRSRYRWRRLGRRSLESLKPSTRCGCSAKARQMRQQPRLTAIECLGARKYHAVCPHNDLSIDEMTA